MKLIQTEQSPTRSRRQSRRARVRSALSEQARENARIVNEALSFIQDEALWLDEVFDEAEELVSKKMEMREAISADKANGKADLEGQLMDALIDTRDFLDKRANEMDGRARKCESLIKRWASN